RGGLVSSGLAIETQNLSSHCGPLSLIRTRVVGIAVSLRTESRRVLRPLAAAAVVGSISSSVGLRGPLGRRPETGESGLGFYQHRLFGGFLFSKPASILWR